MDEKLRKLRRQINDPHTQDQLAAELLRSGIISSHLDDLKLVTDSLVRQGDNATMDGLFDRCLSLFTPATVFLLTVTNDEGEPRPVNVFASENSAIKAAVSQVKATLIDLASEGYIDPYGMQEDYDAMVNHATNQHWEEALDFANQLDCGFWMVREFGLFS